MNGALALILGILALFLGLPVVWTFLETGLVPRLPTALLASALMILAGVFLVLGALLNGVVMTRREMSRLFYLRWAAPPYDPDGLAAVADSQRGPASGEVADAHYDRGEGRDQL